jgi:hypothetical protein
MIIRDISSFIQSVGENHDNRGIIMTDTRKSLTVGVLFESKFYQGSHPSIASLKSLFDNTFDEIHWGNKTTIEFSQLPFLEHIGLYKVTHVTKLTNGDIVVRDALNKPIDSYIGLE